jgi:hypothetical protein
MRVSTGSSSAGGESDGVRRNARGSGEQGRAFLVTNKFGGVRTDLLMATACPMMRPSLVERGRATKLVWPTPNAMVWAATDACLGNEKAQRPRPPGLYRA